MHAGKCLISLLFLTLFFNQPSYADDKVDQILDELDAQEAAADKIAEAEAAARMAAAAKLAEEIANPRTDITPGGNPKHPQTGFPVLDMPLGEPLTEAEEAVNARIAVEAEAKEAADAAKAFRQEQEELEDADEDKTEQMDDREAEKEEVEEEEQD